MKRAGWWVVTVFAVPIALYAMAYLVFRERMFPPQLKESFLARPWGIYPHALAGAIALLLGPFQFHRGLLVRRRPLHRVLGKIYVTAGVVTGAAGVYMAVYAFGGAVTKLGFGALGVLLVVTTIRAFTAVRRRDIPTHREWVLRSYALLYAAVTLRIELPILIAVFRGDFTPAYQIVSWLCWAPNILLIEAYVRRTRAAARPVAEALRPATA
jgi:uncharacterized membrane protein